jgi:hypothetical protein
MSGRRPGRRAGEGWRRGQGSGGGRGAKGGGGVNGTKEKMSDGVEDGGRREGGEKGNEERREGGERMSDGVRDGGRREGGERARWREGKVERGRAGGSRRRNGPFHIIGFWFFLSRMEIVTVL